MTLLINLKIVPCTELITNSNTRVLYKILHKQIKIKQ